LLSSVHNINHILIFVDSHLNKQACAAWSYSVGQIAVCISDGFWTLFLVFYVWFSHTKEYLIPGWEKIFSNSRLFYSTFIEMALPASYKTGNCKSVQTLREKSSVEQNTWLIATWYFHFSHFFTCACLSCWK